MLGLFGSRTVAGTIACIGSTLRRSLELWPGAIARVVILIRPDRLLVGLGTRALAWALALSGAHGALPLPARAGLAGRIQQAVVLARVGPGAWLVGRVRRLWILQDLPGAVRVCSPLASPSPVCSSARTRSMERSRVRTGSCCCLDTPLTSKAMTRCWF